MKFIVLLLISLMILYPIIEAKSSKNKNNHQQSFYSNNKFQIFGFLALSILLAYLYFDNLQKQKLRQAIQSKGNSSSNQVKTNSSDHIYLKQQVSSQETRNQTQFPIYKIVITGGPCGGKTTGLDRIKAQMTQKGFRVFSIPEIPTMVVQAGGMILMSKFSTEEKIKFQSLLIRFQMYAEDYFTKLAEMSKSPSIIICDRGTVDPYAYISKQEFQAIMDEQGWSWVTLRDRRYDRVVFMNSAAVGAEQFYTRSNNNARSQGIQVARALNQKTLDAWTGHPYLSIIANVKGESFNDKMTHAVEAVQQTVGLKMINLSHEKYLIQAPVFPTNLKVEQTEIQEGFLLNDDPRYDEDSIKKRGQNNSYTYLRRYRTAKNQQGDFAQQIRKPLTSLQYVTLKQSKLDPNFNLVHRRRILFAYNNLSYAIDIFDEVKGQKNVHLLRFNSDNKNPQAQIPDFITPLKNVKKDKDYDLRQIARKH